MGPVRIYIGVGSNLGDRSMNIMAARHLLEGQGIKISRLSPLYDNPALCKPGKTMPDFLNGVFEGETDQSPEEILSLLEEIERKLGRTEKGEWKPRTIDLDLLLHGDRVLETEKITIPHPDI